MIILYHNECMVSRGYYRSVNMLDHVRDTNSIMSEIDDIHELIDSSMSKIVRVDGDISEELLVLITQVHNSIVEIMDKYRVGEGDE